MMRKHSSKLDLAIYKKFHECYLRLLRYHLKEKMEVGTTKEREEKITQIIKELNDSFQEVENWYEKLKMTQGLDNKVGYDMMET